MRHRLMLLIGLTVQVSAAATGAEKPIPQDAAKIEKHRRDRLEWNRQTIQGAYDKVGKRDPRWDAQARKAMDLTAKMFSEEVDPQISFKDVFPPAKAAVAAGCDDPMLVYLYNRMAYGPDNPGGAAMIRRIKDAARALAASRYPAFRRSIALRSAGESMLAIKDPGTDVKKEAERFFDDALALARESVAQDERNEFWEDRWLENVLHLIRGYRSLGVEAVAAYKRVDGPLAKIPEMKVLRLLCRGEFWTAYGWEVRTKTLAAKVPEGGFEAFGKRLEVAEEAFNAAWEARPGTAKAASQLLDIDKSIGGDRATMELWFERALKANGDDWGSCWTKLDWLDPKWHGNPEDMLAFGRACRDTKNWRAGITVLCADAYLRLYPMLEPSAKRKFMAQPEVWADIQPIFDEYLKHYPGNNVARTKYAILCYLTGHYREAHVLFEALGDHLTQWSDGVPKFTDGSVRDMKSEAARIATGKPLPNVAGPGQVQPGWIHFGGRNNEGVWSVEVPTRPDRSQVAGILARKLRNVWASTAEGITYTIRVQPLPPASRGGKAKIILTTARGEIVEGYGGKEREAHDATLLGNPASEFLVDILATKPKPKVIRVKLAIIGSRLFELSASGSGVDLSGETVNRFFNSFQFQ